MSKFVLTAQLQLQAPSNVAQVVRQIQSQLNNVSVNVQVQGAAQAQRQIQQVSNVTNEATSAAERMGKAFAVSIRRFAAFSIATRAVGLFTSTLSDSIKTAIDFERQLIKVSQVTGDSIGKLKTLTSTITKLSTDFGVSSQSLLDVSTILLQAGVSAKDTEVALKSLAKAALAPNFDSITETAEGAIAILAQFKLGVGALEDQLGSINAVAGAFAVEASDLIDVIRRTGGVFKSSGGDLNELLALFTSVRATTRESAESIGTGLRTIFTRIQRPKTIEYLKQFGVELTDLNGKFVGPYEAVRQLSSAIAGLGEGDVTFIRIAEELGGFRQIGKVLPLLQQFQTAEAALNVATKANNSLTKDAAIAQESLAIRIVKVKEEFLALVRSVTETTTFQVMANTALTLASALIRIGDAIKPLLPLLAAVASFRALSGIGKFVGSVGTGLASGKTFNKGGKVHHFASGGLVPGVGNGDTVPAMLAPGEFVIRKSSVQKLGASNLAGMNRGGAVQKFAAGGMSTADKIASARASANPNRPRNPTKNIQDVNVPMPKFAKESSVGIATTDFIGAPIKGGISVNRDTDLVNQQIGNLSKSLSSIYGAKNALSYVQKIYKGKKTFSYDATTEGIGQDEESKFKNIINESISSAIDIAANRFSTEVMKTSGPGSIKKLPSFYQTLDQGFRGQLFENVITGLNGRPLSGQDSRRPFDFTRGIGQFKSIYSNLPMNYVDAKISASAAGAGKRGMTSEGISTLRTKASAQLASETIPLISLLERQAGGIGTMTTAGKKTKFAMGGRAKGIQNAPLVDDILQASGSILPRPSAAIQALIKAGGGAVDVDRTLKRTIGDAAYAKAPTSGAKNASLNTYFRDEAKRLQDLKTAKITQFGQELQIAIKNGQLDARKVSIISKSRRVRGAAEYLSSQFGIPTQNMIFTQGGSKQPAIDAIRKKGSRIDRISRFATGGGVGTDTVPALLTPGEFVVNRSSAQRIGYGNLNRMNKVGKYASGGIVQHFKKGGKTGNVSSGQGAFGLAIGLSAFQSLLPAVEENSGAFAKATNSILQLITTLSGLAFALDAFGFSLKGIFSASSVRGFKDFSQSSVIFGRKIKELSNVLANSISRPLSVATQAGIQRFSAGLISLITPFAAVAAGGYLVAKSIYAFNDSVGKLDKAIQSGNIAEAEKNAIGASTQGAGIATSIGVGALITAGSIAFAPAALTLAAGLGIAASTATAFSLQTKTASEFLQDFTSLFGGLTSEQVKANARLEASSKSLEEANKRAAEAAPRALESVANGALSLSEAFDEVERTSKAGIELERNLTEIKRTQKVNEKTVNPDLYKLKEEERLIQRQVDVAKEVGNADEIRIQESRLASIKAQIAKPTMIYGPGMGANPLQKDKSLNLEKMSAISAKALQESSKKASEFLQEQKVLIKEQMTRSAYGNSGSGKFEDFLADLSNSSQIAAGAFSSLSKEELDKAKREFGNISKAVQDAIKAFNALNLGLSTVKSNISASSVSISNYTSSLEFGTSSLQRSLDTLNSSAEGAGQSLSKNDIDQALSDVSDNLKRFGADSGQVKKFEDNFTAITTAQREFSTIIDKTKTNLEAQNTGIKSADAANLNKAFISALQSQLQLRGVDDVIIQRIKDSLRGLKDDDVKQINTGSLEPFKEIINEVAKATLEETKGKEDIIAIDKQLADLTRQRIESERKFIETQKEALSIQLEVRELESKYGGKFLSDAEKRNNLFSRANTGAPEGISPLVTGSPEELQKRNQEIKQRFLAIEALKQEIASKKMSARDAGMVNAEGEKLKAQYEDLQKANKDQIQTIRDLIKLQEDELRIIKEKNKLEQDSIESLIRGDLEKFLEQQAAVGATAAIATGSQRLMNAYGADALSGAFADLKRQSEAGVQTAYGQQIGGPGGLLEQAARYTLEQRGVNDPVLAARVAASTTSAIETKNAEIRTTTAILNAAAQTSIDMSRAQVQTAEITVVNGTISVDQPMVLTTPRSQLEPAPIPNQARALNRGGPVYASNGIFVPRGSDTIPAMLTPGEFVVRREAVNRGNNLQMLQAMNSGSKNGAIAGFANGGKVQYLRTGNQNPVSGGGFGFDPAVINRLSSSLDSFNRTLSANIDRLNTVKLHLVLDTTNINLNLNGGSFLGKLTEDLKKQLYTFIGEQFNLFGVSGSGKIKENRGIVPRN